MKIISYDVEIKSTKINRTLTTPKVYTNDLNSVVFQFNLLDMTAAELTGATATTLLYMNDGSFFQNPAADVGLVGNVFSYVLKESEGNHGGLAQIQLVVKIGTKEYATQLYNFDVVRGLETKVAQEVMIYDWTTLTRDARAYIDQFVADEAVRQQQFETAEANRVTFFETAETNRVSAEQGRVTAETGRVNAESSRVSAEVGRVSAEQTRVTAESTRAQTYATYNARITGLEERTNYIEGYIDYRDDDIVGIEADFANSTFTRIAASSGLSAGSDFNAFEPFGGRRRCTVSDNGTVTSYFGDANFAEDGSIGQVMVEQPKFYYKVVPLKLDKVQDGKGFHLRKARYYVSAKHKPGFKIHPAFVRNGIEKNFVYLSAYEGSLYDVSAMSYISNDAQVADFATDKLSSIAGVMPISGLTQNLTRANARLLAQKRGEGWQQQYAAVVAASQLLMMIEYGSFNMQTALGMGVTGKVDGGGNDAEPTGATTSLGNKSGTAKTINNYDAVSYRGEETPYSNIYKYIDGLNVMANGLHDVYIADSGFVDNKRDGNYKDTGFTLAKKNGYISAFGYSPSCDFLFLPSETLGNSALPVGDNFYQNFTAADQSGWRSVFLGGDSVSTATAGPYYLWVANSIMHKSRTISSRLVYVPGVVA